MDRILTYTVKPEDLPETAGGILNRLLKRGMGLTAHEISRAKFTEGGITLLKDQDPSGLYRPVTVKERAAAGDIIRVLFADDRNAEDKVVPVRGMIRILYEDEDVIVLDKPAGMASHPAHGHYRDSLANYLAGWLQERGVSGQCRAVGRLDKDTSGIVVFAGNAPAAARLFRQKEQGLFRKTYLAVASRPPEKERLKPESEAGGWERIESPLGPVPGMLMKQQVMNPPEGKPALTCWRFLRQCGDRALMEVRIETGRTHQIRVHLASVGMPLVGDSLYGGEPGPRALLHAWRVTFRRPFGGGEISLEAPVPDDMAEVLKAGGLFIPQQFFTGNEKA